MCIEVKCETSFIKLGVMAAMWNPRSKYYFMKPLSSSFFLFCQLLCFLSNRRINFHVTAGGLKSIFMIVKKVSTYKIWIINRILNFCSSDSCKHIKNLVLISLVDIHCFFSQHKIFLRLGRNQIFLLKYFDLVAALSN